MRQLRRRRFEHGQRRAAQLRLGANQLTARRIVECRGENGAFSSRDQLLDVAGIGQATFTQAAGFLKIRDGRNRSTEPGSIPKAIPSRGNLTARLSSETRLMAAGPGHLRVAREAGGLPVEQLANELQIGIPTLRDMVDALTRPGRDPRADLPAPSSKRTSSRCRTCSPGWSCGGRC